MRRALRRDLPEEAFAPQPMRGVVGLLQVPVMIALGAFVTVAQPPWYIALAIALVLGQMITSVALVVGHEGLHHSVFRSRKWESFAAAIGLAPFLVTPGNWRAWHVQAHHGRTNRPGFDPDCLPTLEKYPKSRLQRFIHAVAPGSGHWSSYFSFFFLLTMEGQLFLWHYASQPEYADIQMNRRRERLLTVLLIGFWMASAFFIGPRASLFVIAIPMLSANYTLMAYIATNHWLSEATPQTNNPFLNTASTTTLPFIDRIHFQFSYHQEHHVFPSMSGKWLPEVRTALRRLDPSASVVYPQWKAVLALYRKPAMYLDERTLVRPGGLKKLQVSEVRGLMK
jgi:fatty acid desaturase